MFKDNFENIEREREKKCFIVVGVGRDRKRGERRGRRLELERELSHKVGYYGG